VIAVNTEFREKYSGRYFGKYRARVTDAVTDPKTLGRIKAVCPVVLGEEELGWALPSPPMGGGVNTGQLRLPLVNDYVWLEFEEGDPSRPIWSHGPWGRRAGVSTVPRHSRGVNDSTDYSRREYGNVPPTQYLGEYGYVDFLGYRDGSFIEVDSTPGAGRVQLSHFTGTRLEMTHDGSLQEIAVQSARRQIGENNNVQVIGREDYSVGNDQKVSVGGNVTREVAGKVTESYYERTEQGQTLSQQFVGNHNILVGGTWTHRCLSQALINVGGQLGFQCAQNIQMSASEYVEIIGMNSNYTASNAALLQGYNGDTLIQGTMVDPIAGTYISNAYAKLSPSATLPTDSTLELGVSLSPLEIPAGLLQLKGSPLKNILLGGEASWSQALYGTSFNSSMVTYLTGMQTFVGSIAVDPGLKSVAPLTSAAAATFLPLVSTLLGLFATQSFLSPFVYLK
jgi:hypothetical protein